MLLVYHAFLRFRKKNQLPKGSEMQTEIDNTNSKVDSLWIDFLFY